MSRPSAAPLSPGRHLTLFLPLLLLVATLPTQAQYIVTHLEKPYNTPGSETGAIRVGDTILAYSSIQPSTSHNKQFHFDNTQMRVMQARIARSGKIARPRLSRWNLNTRRDHTGNLALDPLTHDLYFTRASTGDPDLKCEIWWARKLKRGWSKPQRLRGPLNLKGYTATQPAVARLADSTVILYFSSNRPGGTGGLDLWYTLVRNGNTSEPVNLGPNINSPADEITPFFDQPNTVLYFSSNRMGGKGGYDIYCSGGNRNTWQPAEPVCSCLNSEQNDIYFTITERDSASGIPVAGYLSSNRKDSYFWSDSMCCNDLYRWTIDSSALPKPPQPDTILPPPPPPPAPEPVITRASLRFMFPLFLYFHNDDPDPKSRSSETATSYTDCQHRYAALRNDYLAHQHNANDSALMQQFFDTCVEGNYRRVEALFDYLEEQLDEGRFVALTIAGYASPLFKDSYNQTLSQRRIATFINMIHAWRDSMFADAIANGRLTLQQEPHGAVEPTTASRNADPVYGLPAAMARRIEILACEVSDRKPQRHITPPVRRKAKTHKPHPAKKTIPTEPGCGLPAHPSK